MRPDNPRQMPDKNSGEAKILKYEYPKGSAMRLDCPPRCRPKLDNPNIPLWITEGQKKADSLATQGLCTLALLGVWNFKGRNRFGGKVFLADWDYVALNGRNVFLVFDSDSRNKHEVRAALERLCEHLQRKGAHVSIVNLPMGEHGAKVGVDDWFAQGHTVRELQILAEGPMPTPVAAAPRVELLDDCPKTIRRPLCLVDGHAYAAIWPYVRETRTESTDGKGNIVTHNPPKVTTKQRLLIVRDDGVVFGDARPLSELGAEVCLPEIPESEKLWIPLQLESMWLVIARTRQQSLSESGSP